MSSTIEGQEQQQLPPLRRPRGLEHLLEGRVGIVTGASRGIGAATAVLLASSGARVVLVARDGDGLHRTEATIIKEIGGEALAIPTDVTDGASVERMVKATLDRFGRLDLAFNDAGSGHMPRPLAEVPVEEFEGAIRTNVLGTFLSMKYEIPAILQGGGGSIVNMSSTAGLEAVNGIAGYVAGKHAIIGLTKTAALDYAAQNIRVNVLAPGPIYTERLAIGDMRAQASMGVPMRRVGDREEVATIVVWLCSDLSSFVTGAVIPVDGGRMAGVAFARPGTPTKAAGSGARGS